MRFDPCDYAGWITTPEEEKRLDELRTYFDRRIPFAEEDLDLIRRTGAYTKRTCLWGDFRAPEPKRIEPVRVCSQGSWLQRLGGTGEATKAARSVTPAGFAIAFHAANAGQHARMENDEEWEERMSDRRDRAQEKLSGGINI